MLSKKYEKRKKSTLLTSANKFEIVKYPSLTPEKIAQNYLDFDEDCSINLKIGNEKKIEKFSSLLDYRQNAIKDSQETFKNFEYSSKRISNVFPVIRAKQSYSSSLGSFRKNAQTKSHTPEEYKLKNELFIPTIPYLNIENAKTVSSSINHSWKSGSRGPFLASVLSGAFKYNSNLFSLGLFLTIHSPEFSTIDTGLSIFVMNELKKWIKDNGQDKIEKRYLNYNIQKAAFDSITLQRDINLIKLIIEIYKMDKIKKSLLGSIKQMAELGFYQEACQISILLKLWNIFDINLFVIPCFFQGKNQTAEEYLSGTLEGQTQTVAFFDGFLDNKDGISDYIEEHDIRDVTAKKFDTNYIGKLVSRLIEKFSIHPQHCPYSCRIKRSIALNKLLQEKYVDELQMNQAALDEKIEIYTKGDCVLQEEALFLLRLYNDFDRAANFAVKCNIPLKKIPIDIRERIKELRPKAFEKLVNGHFS